MNDISKYVLNVPKPHGLVEEKRSFFDKLFKPEPISKYPYQIEVSNDDLPEVMKLWQVSTDKENRGGWRLPSTYEFALIIDFDKDEFFSKNFGRFDTFENISDCYWTTGDDNNFVQFLVGNYLRLKNDRDSVPNPRVKRQRIIWNYEYYPTSNDPIENWNLRVRLVRDC
jgi:hypothetical protein